MIFYSQSWPLFVINYEVVCLSFRGYETHNLLWTTRSTIIIVKIKKIRVTANCGQKMLLSTYQPNHKNLLHSWVLIICRPTACIVTHECEF